MSVALCQCGCGTPAAIAAATRSRLGHVAGQPTRYARGHNSRSTPAVLWFNRSRGRWYVIGRDGRRHLWYRVVAANMIGRELLPDEVVHHINGDSTDDRPENLAVMTAGEHSRLHQQAGDFNRVVVPIGEANHAAKLTEAQVREIRRRYTGKRGEQAALAREFGVTKELVGAIVRGKIWRHLLEPVAALRGAA